MPLKVHGKIDREYGSDREIMDYSYIIDTISDLEDFIAYNRAYIVTLQFTDKLSKGE